LKAELKRTGRRPKACGILEGCFADVASREVTTKRDRERKTERERERERRGEGGGVTVVPL